MQFPTNSLIEAKRWALSWGKAAKVLGPKELAEIVKKDMYEALVQY